jgi:hypothetical protein
MPKQDPARSRLRRMVPKVGSFFTPLKLVEAFREYDEFFALSRRRYVPPNFAEMRHVLNIAQVGWPRTRLLCLFHHSNGSRVCTPRMMFDHHASEGRLVIHVSQGRGHAFLVSLPL